MEPLYYESTAKPHEFFNTLKQAGPGVYMVDGDVRKLEPGGELSELCDQYSRDYCQKHGLQYHGPGSNQIRPLTWMRKDAPDPGYICKVRVNEHQWDDGILKIPLSHRAEQIVMKVEKGAPQRIEYDKRLLIAIRNYCYNLDDNPYSVEKDGENIVISYRQKLKSIRQQVQEAAEHVAGSGEEVRINISADQWAYAQGILRDFNKIQRNPDDHVMMRQTSFGFSVAPFDERHVKPFDPKSMRSRAFEVAEQVMTGNGPKGIEWDLHKDSYLRSLVSEFNSMYDAKVSVRKALGGLHLVLPEDIEEHAKMKKHFCEAWDSVKPFGMVDDEEFQRVRSSFNEALKMLKKREPA